MLLTKKRSLLIMIIIVIILIISYFWFFNTENISIEVEGVPVTKGDIIKTVNLSGSISPLDSEVINLPAGVVVEKVYAEENKFVEAGQLLAELNSDNLKISIEKTNLLINQLEDDLITASGDASAIEKSLLRNALLLAKEDFDKASKDFESSENEIEKSEALLSGGAISQAEYDKVLSLSADIYSYYNTAKINYDNANKRYMDYDRTQATRVNSIKTQIESARLDLSSLKLKYEENLITSSISGVITSFPVKEGRSILPDSRIEINNTNNFQFKSMVPQEDAVLIDLGQKSLVNISGISTSYEGAVTSIGTIAIIDTLSGSRTPKVEVAVTLEATDNQVVSGFDADAVVEVVRLTDELIIKRESVKKDLDGKEFVFVIKDNKAIKTYITTGASDNTNIAVLSGINENDIIIVNPSLDVQDGSPLKVEIR
ncbi:MAG: HlyD family efflux transporter periplasmic adaptor subunit [Dethiosulfatibacter sp.]|nr:HlyD family efflux transporter periplasmic adaptor subunit [Dethiosulfatibacter sp.]